jgi:hypothetical protein
MKKFPFSQNLFWDTEIGSIDLKKHRRSVIERVITRGSHDDFKKLLTLYTKKQISFALRMSTVLDPKTRNFCSKYFNIPIEEMYVSDFYN